MRHARAEDYHRRIREKPDHWPVRINRVAFKGIPGLGEGDIPLSSVLTVLCGPNGVGKTTLLRAIWASLDRDAAAGIITTARKLTAGTASVDIIQRGDAVTCTTTFVDGEIEGECDHDIEIVHIDTSSEVVQQQEIFCKSENADDITNGAGARALNSKELASLNYLTKRDYSSVNIYEVELFKKVVPFFEVTFGSDRYDSRTMGGGELAAFYLWWALDRAEDCSIVLIEEPECYLSPGSQEAFRDYLASAMFNKKLCVVMTSHSSQIISPLPKESARYFRRDAAGIKLITDRPPPILLESLGIKPPIDTLVFVEDAAAAIFCRLWLERFDPNLARRIEIAVRNGDGEIINAIRQLPGPYRFLRFVGLFDGDMRGKVPKDVDSSSVCLPGDQAIEKVFRQMVTSDPSKVSEFTGRNDLETILFGLQGSDHHEWYERLSLHLGLSKPQLFAVLFSIWMRDEKNRAEAAAAYEQLLVLVEGPSTTAETNTIPTEKGMQQKEASDAPSASASDHSPSIDLSQTPGHLTEKSEGASPTTSGS